MRIRFRERSREEGSTQWLLGSAVAPSAETDGPGSATGISAVAQRIMNRMYHMVHDRTSMKRVRDIFNDCDADGNGRVTKDEFAQAMSHMKLKVSKSEIDALWPILDRDGNGTLDHLEFEAMVRAHCRHLYAKEVERRRQTRLRREQNQEQRRQEHAEAGEQDRPRTSGSVQSQLSSRSRSSQKSAHASVPVIAPGAGGFKAALMQRPQSPWRKSMISDSYRERFERGEYKPAYHARPNRSMTQDYRGHLA